MLKRREQGRQLVTRKRCTVRRELGAMTRARDEARETGDEARAALRRNLGVAEAEAEMAEFGGGFGDDGFDGGLGDDAANVQLSPDEMTSLHAAVRAFVRDPDAKATVAWPASAPG